MHSVRQALCTLALLFAPLPLLHGQSATDPDAASATQPYTLHVYEDLVQLPTMVLTPHLTTVEHLSAQSFTLRVDGGPPFHPRHVRPEQDDPISMAVLMDVSTRSSARLSHDAEQSLNHLPTPWLLPHDRVSVYALDCSLVRSAVELAYTPGRLQTTLQHVFSSELLKEHPIAPASCASERLLETTATVLRELAQAPGRRVLLLVTNGTDHLSRINWHDLERLAGRYSISVIGLQPASTVVPSAFSRFQRTSTADAQQQSFENLCAETGGFILPIDGHNLAPELRQVVTLLRDRYILEFARASNAKAGVHDLDVQVPDRSALVRSAGISFPLRSPAAAPELGTVPTDPSRLPVFGGPKKP